MGCSRKSEAMMESKKDRNGKNGGKNASRGKASEYRKFPSIERQFVTFSSRTDSHNQFSADDREFALGLKTAIESVLILTRRP